MPYPFQPSPPPFPPGPPASPQPVQGPHFSYLLPPGWTVGEEGPFALVLRSADWLAGIVVFGQTGLMHPMSPDQFAHQAMAGVMRLAADVRLVDVQPTAALPGYTQAAVMRTAYTVSTPNGMVPIEGVVTSQVAIGYGICGGTITLASSEASRWPAYQAWLPQVASAARNTGPNAFGGASMAQTIHGIVQRDGQAQTHYRAWSESNWQAVTNQRWASDTRRQEAMGPMLTGQEWLADPYGNPMTQRSTTPAAIWVSRDGREVHSDNPTFDPRTPYDSDWRRIR